MSTASNQTLFYAWDSNIDPVPKPPELPAGVSISVWRPARSGPPLGTMHRIHTWAWWLFDNLGVFANRNCGIVYILHGKKVLHSSLVTPRYFRFPDMGRDDLQIGATWTDPSSRGQGYAKAAVSLIHQFWEGEFCRMWYLVEADNVASVRVIEMAGYRLVGKGGRYSQPGLRLFGQYRMTEHIKPL